MLLQFHIPLDERSMCGTGLWVCGNPAAESILVKPEGVPGFAGNMIAWLGLALLARDSDFFLL